MSKTHVAALRSRPASHLVSAQSDAPEDAAERIALVHNLADLAKLGHGRYGAVRLGGGVDTRNSTRLRGRRRLGLQHRAGDFPLQLLQHEPVVDLKAAGGIRRLNREQDDEQKNEG